jgi:hypothetical protein
MVARRHMHGVLDNQPVIPRGAIGVSHLRDKIEDDPAMPVFVLTVRGVGYAFAER